ncbi:MAG: 3-dehydroquinate dehydratase II, partial [uncultured Arthrobacter sp.]
ESGPHLKHPPAQRPQPEPAGDPGAGDLRHLHPRGRRGDGPGRRRCTGLHAAGLPVQFRRRPDRRHPRCGGHRRRDRHQRRRLHPHLDRHRRRAGRRGPARGGGPPEQRAPARGLPAHLLHLRGRRRRDRGGGNRGIPVRGGAPRGAAGRPGRGESTKL